MYKIETKRKLAPTINLFTFSAEEVAAKAKPGQFVIIRLDEDGERIPLTIANVDKEQGTISVACHEVGKTTAQLGSLKEGDAIPNLLGPLGKPAAIEKFGTVLCVGGGVMAAPIHFKAKALREAGNYVIGVVGAATKDHLVFLEEMSKTCNELYIATDDGSEGYKGIDFLKDLITKKKIDRVVAEGPVLMLKAVADTTHPLKIPTVVDLIPTMIDGMGMCGACRVGVGGKMLFACVDGLEFDGHQVDFDELLARLKTYTLQEKVAKVFWEEGEKTI
ncbi:sulfide/dihydroorotate dehydrogenase-like FAD/NAD-binding protein [Candidatus Bathyarchaeota archaeon]|nr:sulfide/dihydroorotate dehydrogenase-like FAD/NAD-binding protein [Candidatus Bathyarchaeota archaeon]